MANLLKKIDGIVNESEKKWQVALLKDEVINNIKDLSEEIHYLKDKVKLLVSSNDRAELTDTIFKLRDLRSSMENRKQQWQKVLSDQDEITQLTTFKAMDMLKSTTQNLEHLLEETMTYKRSA